MYPRVPRTGTEEDMATVEKSVKEIVHRYTDEGYNDANTDAIADCVAEDVIVHGLPGVDGSLQGRDAYLEWAEEGMKGVPDLHLETEDLLAEENKAAVRWTVTGTQEGTVGELPATGESFEYEAFAIVRIEDDVIVEKWYRPDELGMMQQLGLV